MHANSACGAQGYSQGDPKKRSPGAMLSYVGQLGLLGTVIRVAWQLLSK